MRKKPEIIPSKLIELNRIFDEDLVNLSKILGQEFQTATFKDNAIAYKWESGA